MNRSREGFNVLVGSKRVWAVLVRRVKDGPFHVRFCWKNKVLWRSTDCHAYTSAESAAREIIRKHCEEFKAKALTLRSAIDTCLKSRWPNPKDKSGHYGVTKLILEKFCAHARGEKLNLASLSTDDAVQIVQRYIDSRKTLKPQSIIDEQRYISRLFSWLIQRRLVGWLANPASKQFLDLPVVHRKPKPPVSPDELAILLKAARETASWPTVLLCVTTGLRHIGVMRLKWSDVNFETGKLRVFEKQRERWVPLSQWTLAELKAWKEKHGGEYIVTVRHKNTPHWHVQQIRERFKLRPEVTLQGCRRTFISRAMDAGVSAELVASIAGNSVAVIEKHYKDLSTLKAEHVAELVDVSGLVDGEKSAGLSKILSKGN